MSAYTCRKCGSINTRVRTGTVFEPLLAALFGTGVACLRCKWQGRVRVSTNGQRSRRSKREEASPAPGRQPSAIDLDALDRGLSDAPLRRDSDPDS